MAKINFDKVDSLTSKEIKQRNLDAMLGEETESQGIPKLYLIESIRYDLMQLPQYDKDFFKFLGVSKKEIFTLIKSPQSLTDKDWQLLLDIRERIDQKKNEMADKLPKLTDEELIEAEKKRHIYKRFNINERWLPLH